MWSQLSGYETNLRERKRSLSGNASDIFFSFRNSNYTFYFLLPHFILPWMQLLFDPPSMPQQNEIGFGKKESYIKLEMLGRVSSVFNVCILFIYNWTMTGWKWKNCRSICVLPKKSVNVTTCLCGRNFPIFSEWVTKCWGHLPRSFAFHRAHAESKTDFTTSWCKLWCCSGCFASFTPKSPSMLLPSNFPENTFFLGIHLRSLEFLFSMKLPHSSVWIIDMWSIQPLLLIL